MNKYNKVNNTINDINKYKAIGIYIHIPFCKSKCSYCDFLSFNLNNQYLEEEYFKALKKEIENTILKLNKIYKEQNQHLFKQLNLPIVVDTIYIGGGTPSFICSKYIKSILEAIRKEFDVLKNAEITIELNPESTTEEKLKEYKNLGINRISMGLQTTNDKILKQLGRLYTYEEFQKKYLLAKKYFNNINVDLMFGLPNQTIDDVRIDLKEIIKLNPKHISTYSLILEQNTKLYNEVSNFKIKIPEDTLNRDMYWIIKKQLEKHNYIHYEISNFSKKDYESKHNINCWKQKEYLGFGIGASSYFNNIRFININNLPLYIDNINNNIVNITIEEIQTIEEKEKEFVFLHLRMLEGLNIEDFKNKFKKDPLDLFKNEINKLLNIKLIEITENNKYIRLTEKGLDLANIVWEEFI